MEPKRGGNIQELEIPVKTMKAVRLYSYGGPEVLKYEDAMRPMIEPDEVLIKVYAAGVNPVDWKIREGYMKERLSLVFPAILGGDFSGVVEEVGPDVKRLKTGDEVYGRADFIAGGSYAEYAAVKESSTAKKPMTIDHEHAASVPIAALTAWQALFEHGGLEAGQAVLIHGAAGGVGHFAVQLAKWNGSKVIGTGSGSHLPFITEMGADETIDYVSTPFEERVKDVDIVLDLIGGDTQDRSWRVLKKGGILVSTVGIKSPEMADKFEVRGQSFMARPDADQLKKIAELIDRGKIYTVVSTIMSLKDAAIAQELSQSKHVHGKIVLKVV